jgi:membrane protease YdiL (CAAX protease family)
MEKPKEVSSFHVAIMAVLPLVLYILITPIIIVFAVSPTRFFEKPIYYIYTYGPILWSVYHVFLALLAWRFLRSEGDSLGGIVGSLRGKELSSLATILGLIGLSVLIFQIIEPIASDVIYGQAMMEQLLNEYRMVPLALVLYGILVTSLTAGVCEEIVWRGYIQTRLEHKLGGRVWTAIAIQAVLFGLWHSLSVHAIFTAIFGLIFGFVYARTRRLAPIMISHWLGDVVGFSAMYFLM